MGIKADVNKQLLYKYLEKRDRETYEKIFEENLKLIHMILNKIKLNNKENVYDDLFQTGCIGLHYAIVSFNESKIEKVSFSTYACKWIQNQIFNEIRKIPTNTISFEEPLKDTGEITLGETLECEIDFEKEILEDNSNEYKKKKIEQAISRLDDMERAIVKLYYGLDGEDTLTLREIAKIFNCTHQTIYNKLSAINFYLNNELKEFRNEYSSNKNSNKKRSCNYIVSCKKRR